MMRAFFFALALVFYSQVYAIVETISPLTTKEYFGALGQTLVYDPTPSGVCSKLVTFGNNSQVGQTYPNVYTSGSLSVHPLDPTSFTCGATVRSGVMGTTSGAGFNAALSRIGGTCPAATPPYTYNDLTARCERAAASCPSNGTVSEHGLFDWGTDPSITPPWISGWCASNGCNVRLDYASSPDRRSRVGGIYHYYAQGQYSYDSTTCTPSTGGGGSPVAVLTAPPESCASGQIPIRSISGVLNCYTDGTTPPASGVPSTPPASGVPSTPPASGVPSTPPASGVPSTPPASGTPSPPSSGSPVDTSQYCRDNPTVSFCTTYDLGTAPSPDPIGTNTVDISAVNLNAFTFSGNAACPSPRVVHVGLSNTSMTFSYQPFCDFLSIFRLIAIAVAFYGAALIMFGQRVSGEI